MPFQKSIGLRISAYPTYNPVSIHQTKRSSVTQKKKTHHEFREDHRPSVCEDYIHRLSSAPRTTQTPRTHIHDTCPMKPRSALLSYPKLHAKKRLTINFTKQRLAHKRALHHRSIPNTRTIRSLRGCDVGRGVRDEAHGDEDDEEVEPDGAVLAGREGVNEDNIKGTEGGRERRGERTSWLAIRSS